MFDSKIAKALTLMLLAAAAALVITGCGAGKIEGKVVVKEVVDGYDYEQKVADYDRKCKSKQVRDSNGRTTTRQECKQVFDGYDTITYSVPTCYQIEVRGENGGKTCVSKKTYDSLEIGDTYSGTEVSAKDRKTKVG